MWETVRVGHEDGQGEADAPAGSSKAAVAATDEIDARGRAIGDAELGYLFATEPLAGDIPLLGALTKWLEAWTVALGIATFSASKLAQECVSATRAIVSEVINGDGVDSKWMREFLALSDGATRAVRACSRPHS